MGIAQKLIENELPTHFSVLLTKCDKTIGFGAHPTEVHHMGAGMQRQLCPRLRGRKHGLVQRQTLGIASKIRILWGWVGLSAGCVTELI